MGWGSDDEEDGAKGTSPVPEKVGAASLLHPLLLLLYPLLS